VGLRNPKRLSFSFMMNLKNKRKRRFTTVNLREDIHQFITGFVNEDPDTEVTNIVVEPNQISLHLFLDWLQSATWNNEQRSNRIRSPRWGGID
jgi:hypothetical protein